MESTKNIIHQSSINLQYLSQHSARSGNLLVEEIFESLIKPQIKVAVEGKVPEDTHFEFEKLEIDIGSIHEKELKSELGNRIRIALEKTLESRLSFNLPNRSAGTLAAGKSNYAIEALRVFLLYGYLPHWFKKTGTLADLLNSIIDDHAQYLKEFLYENSSNDTVKTRLLVNLNGLQQEKVFHIFEPVNTVWILSYRKSVMNLWGSDTFGFHGVQEFAANIDFFILDYLLQNRSPAFSKSDFSEKIARHLLSLAQNDPFIESPPSRIDNKDLRESVRAIYSAGKKAKNAAMSIKPGPAGIAMLLNKWRIKKNDVKKAELKSQIREILEEDAQLMEFIAKLNEAGVKVLLELLHAKKAKEIVRMIESFVSEIPSDVLRETGGIRKVNFKELVLLSVFYLERSAEKAINKEFLANLLAASVTSRPQELIHSTSFRRFLAGQKHVVYKKVKSLIQEDDQIQRIWETQHELSKVILKSEAPEEQLKVSESTMLRLFKRKIISDYLLSGYLSSAHYDLSLQDIQSIFIELLHSKDDFLLHVIRLTKQPELLAKRVEQLINAESKTYLQDYLAHFYPAEYESLSAQISKFERVVPGITYQSEELPATLIFKALAHSKSGNKADLLKGVMIVEWFDALRTYSAQSIVPLFSKLGHGKKKSEEALMLLSGLDKSTKSWLRKRYEKEAEKLLAIIRGKTILDSPAEVRSIVQSLVIYHQFDDRFFVDLLAKYPDHYLILLSAFELHLEKTEWKILQKSFKEHKELKNIIVSYEKRSFVTLEEALSSSSEHGVEIPKSKKTKTQALESFRLSFFQLLQDESAFNRFIDATADAQIVATIHFNDKLIQSSLEVLFAFVPKAISGKGDPHNWRSVIIRYAVQKYIDDPAISAARFAGELKQYLSHQTDVFGSHLLIEDVLLELKESKRKELVNLFSSIDAKEKTAVKDLEPSKTMAQLLALLRFYSTYQILPWWSTQSGISSVIRELLAISRTYPQIFSNELVKEERASSLISSIVQVLPTVHLTQLGKEFSTYPELQNIWQKALKKSEKKQVAEELPAENGQVVNQEKPADKRSDDLNLLIKSARLDVKQLPALLYKHTDAEIAPVLFAKYPEVQKQLQLYLGFSKYIYHQDASPPKWRLMIYTIAIDLTKDPGQKATFDQKLIKNIEDKTDGIDWVAALKKVSVVPDIQFPKAFVNVLDRQSPASTIHPKTEKERGLEDISTERKRSDRSPEQAQQDESARLLLIKRKIVTDYLLTGLFSSSHYDLSLQDLQNIFAELLQSKNDFIVHVIRLSRHAEALEVRIEQLINTESRPYVQDYLAHFYLVEYESLSELLSEFERVVPTKQFQSEAWQEKLIFKALVHSKGGSKADLLKGIILIEWFAWLGTYSDKSKSALIGNLGSGRKKSAEILKLFSGLDKSTKSWIREKFKEETKELLAIIRGLAMQQGSDSSKVRAIVQTVFIYQQLDDRLLQDLLAKNPDHRLLLLSAFEWHLEKDEWKSLQKRLKENDKLKKIIASYDRYAIERSIPLPYFSSELKTQVPKSKKTKRDEAETRRLALFQLVQDDPAFERFVTSTADVQIASGIYFDEKEIRSALESLLAFSPKAISVEGASNLWRSIVISYAAQKYIDDPAISATRFAGELGDYLSHQTDLFGSQYLVEDVLRELKESKRKELAKLFSKIEIEETDLQVKEVKRVKADQEPTEMIAHILALLRFYSRYKLLPWWSAQNDLSSLINELISFSHTHPTIFADEIVKEEKSRSLISSIVEVLPTLHLTRIGREFGTYPELKTIWKKALKKLDKKRTDAELGAGTGRITSLEKLPGKRSDDLDTLIRSAGFDSKQRPALLYQYDDSQIIPVLFKEFPEVQKQLEYYLKFSKYFYHQDATPPRWRLMIYTIAIDQLKEPGQKAMFDQELIEYIEAKVDGIDWVTTLKKVSALPNIQIPRSLAQLVDRHSPASAIHATQAQAQKESPRRKELSDSGEDIEFEANISNAGLIIAWPFLTRLFEHFGFLQEGKFLNTESQTRAVYMLQYLVFNDIEYPEYELLLNKILVGMPQKIHLDPFIELSSNEKEMTGSLLNGIIQNWEKVKNSSPEGIQETFLQRQGILRIQSDKILLDIEKKGVDVLLDSIAWNLGIVKLPWMSKPLHINWP